jgi:hypothetical protein
MYLPFRADVEVLILLLVPSQEAWWVAGSTVTN